MKNKIKHKTNKENHKEDVTLEKAKIEGITLITLVITIVILLILASVGISISLENNGIFNRAKQAKKEMEKATITEQIQLEILDKQIENDEENISEKEIESILKKYGEVNKDEEGKITGVKTEKGGYDIPLKDIFDGEKIKEPIGTPGESGYAGGSYNDPYIPVGFKHIGTEDWNHGYTIIGETISIENEFVWVPCVLTAEEYIQAQNNGDTVQIFQKNLDYPKYNGLSVIGDTEEASYIQTSVGKYQGFYIAKYEAGIPGTTQSVTSNHNTSVTGNILPVSKPNVGVWNFISRTDAISLSNKMINYEETGVYSTLTSGTAWDTTLQWITNTVDSMYATDSAGKGNHSSSIAVTSSNNNTAYSKNNIYDMAGNIWEWTTENCTSNNSNSLIDRGRWLEYEWFSLSSSWTWQREWTTICIYWLSPSNL